MGTDMPSQPINKYLILTFLNLDFSAFYPILAFKCYYDAFLAEWWLSGSSGYLIGGGSGPWGKDVAPGLKMSPTMPKKDSESLFYYILKFSI